MDKNKEWAKQDMRWRNPETNDIFVALSKKL